MAALPDTELAELLEDHLGEHYEVGATTAADVLRGCAR